MRSSASRPTTTTAPRRSSSTARSSRRRRKSASRARSTTRASRSTPSTTASRKAGVGLGDIDHVVFYDKPFLKFERLLETYLAFAPRGFQSFRMAMPVWLKEKLFQKDLILPRS
jgi:predicted NodU family carbamoyl transferase